MFDFTNKYAGTEQRGTIHFEGLLFTFESFHMTTCKNSKLKFRTQLLDKSSVKYTFNYIYVSKAHI